MPMDFLGVSYLLFSGLNERWRRVFELQHGHAAAFTDQAKENVR